MFGRKRSFSPASSSSPPARSLSGAAGDEQMLVAGRVVQGLGAAAMLPLSLAIVCNAFPGSEQPRALGIWAGVSALALAIGPLARRGPGRARLAGDLLDQPAGGGDRVRDHGRGGAASRPIPAPGDAIDYPGLVALAVGMMAVVLALVQSRVWGWGRRRTLGLLGAGLLCLAAFWAIEHRVANPIVDFSLFRNGPYFGASAAAFALVGAYWAVMFFQPQYLQDVHGRSAIASRAADPADHRADGLLLAALGPADRPLRRPRADDRRHGSAASPACSCSPRSRPTAPTRCCSPATCCSGSRSASSTRRCRPRRWRRCRAEKAGIASGVLAMDRVLAGAVGLAVTGAVFHAPAGGRAASSLRGRARRLDLGPGRASAPSARCSPGPSCATRAPGPDPRWPATSRRAIAAPRHHRRFHL